jgi:hypothetical protein
MRAALALWLVASRRGRDAPVTRVREGACCALGGPVLKAASVFGALGTTNVKFEVAPSSSRRHGGMASVSGSSLSRAAGHCPAAGLATPPTRPADRATSQPRPRSGHWQATSWRFQWHSVSLGLGRWRGPPPSPLAGLTRAPSRETGTAGHGQPNLKPEPGLPAIPGTGGIEQDPAGSLRPRVKGRI